MSLDRFEEHLADRSPAFRCFAARDRSETIGFLAHVTHEIGEPATRTPLAALDALIGDSSPSLRRFFELHDGMALYKDRNFDSQLRSHSAGIRFFRFSLWQRETDGVRTGGMFGPWLERGGPEWLRHGIVFGEIPHSANYFLIHPQGAGRGPIYYLNHDGFKNEALAPSFDEFLSLIVSNPPGFLRTLGCYTRYFDGITRTQWIPKEYLSDARPGDDPDQGRFAFMGSGT
jgi:hypothetical protein